MASCSGVLKDYSHSSLNEAFKSQNNVNFKLIKTGEPKSQINLNISCLNIAYILIYLLVCVRQSFLRVGSCFATQIAIYVAPVCVCTFYLISFSIVPPGSVRVCVGVSMCAAWMASLYGLLISIALRLCLAPRSDASVIGP